MISTTLTLRAGALRLALRPDLGGCIAGFWHGGRHGDVAVLRSTEPEALASARPSGSFPLVPYSNRLGFRRFDWLGRHHSTAANFDDNPHSVHGVAWQRAWEVVAASETQAELVYRHAPDAHWPFAFDVRQYFMLTPEALTVSLDFSNQADEAQPVGLGWHPYFPKRQGSRMDIDVSTRWPSDTTGLPTHAEPQAGIHAAVADLAHDHCFGGFQGVARIRDERLDIALTSDLPWLVVFTPDVKPYYCVEPVSHVSNAIQMADPLAHGLRSVPPQGRTSAWMTLSVKAAA
jgi:aldose 1-epimerase